MENISTESLKVTIENHENRLCFIERKTENYGVMEYQVKNISEKVDNIDKKLSAWMEKPAKDMSYFKMAMIIFISSSFLTGIATYFMKIILK